MSIVASRSASGLHRDYTCLVRLILFDLESFELRRLRYGAIEYYKILNNSAPLNTADYFKLQFPSSASARVFSPIVIVEPIGITMKTYCQYVFSIDTLTVGTTCK